MSAPTEPIRPHESHWPLPGTELFDGSEGNTLPANSAVLTFEADDPRVDVGADTAHVAVALDLGPIIGVLDLVVPIPISVLREAYCAAAWHTIEAGELMAWVPGREHVKVVQAPGPDGTVTIASKAGTHRVPAKHLHRLRQFGEVAE